MHVTVYLKYPDKPGLFKTLYSPLTCPAPGAIIGFYVVDRIQHDVDNDRIIVHLKKG